MNGKSEQQNYFVEQNVHTNMVLQERLNGRHTKKYLIVKSDRPKHMCKKVDELYTY